MGSSQALVLGLGQLAHLSRRQHRLRRRVQEFALLELLNALRRRNGLAVANGLRARVNEWHLDSGPQFTQTVDEAASEQLGTFLGALDDVHTMPTRLLLEVGEG